MKLSWLGIAGLALAAAAGADDAAVATTEARAAEALGAELFAALGVPADPAMLARAGAAFAEAGAAACAVGEARLVALAPRADGSVPVFLLSRAAEGEGVFSSGHFRLDLAADGSAGPLTRFGEGCDRLEWDPADPEANMQVAYVRRSAATAPSEIDVLISHELPFALGVVTGSYVWPLIGGSVADPVEADPEMGAGG